MEKTSKTEQIFTISRETYLQLKAEGLRYKSGLVCKFYGDTYGWCPVHKHLIISALYVKWGQDLKYTEIEREIFPAIVGWFSQDKEATVTE